MLIIRNNVFETNSSSSHVLAINNEINDEDDINCFTNYNDKEIIVTYKEYGYNGPTITKIQDKIDYLFMTRFVKDYYGNNAYDNDAEEKYAEFLKDLFPQIENVKFKRSLYYGIDSQAENILDAANISNKDFLLKPYICYYY